MSDPGIANPAGELNSLLSDVLGFDATTWTFDPRKTERLDLGQIPPLQEAFSKRRTFYVNANWDMTAATGAGSNIVGQMYVESLEPLVKLQPHPIVLIHDDFQTGQVWLTKPDGNPGWASFFLGQGFHVYIVDLPPAGRSNFLAPGRSALRETAKAARDARSAEFVEREHTAPGGRPVQQQAYAQAVLHNQWPGTGLRGDPIFAKYCASLESMPIKKLERQTLAQDGLRSLLQVTGKAILVGSGAGGNAAWLAADVEPATVAMVVALEPNGPPFGVACGNSARVYDGNITYSAAHRPYGLTDIPLTYDPPADAAFGFDSSVSRPLDIAKVQCFEGAMGACILQKPLTLASTDVDQVIAHDHQAQVRELMHLKKMPHAIFTAQASPHTTYDWATVEFLKQAGASVDWIKLEDFQIYGNGHLMHLELNSDAVAGLVNNWIRMKLNIDDGHPRESKDPFSGKEADTGTVNNIAMPLNLPEAGMFEFPGPEPWALEPLHYDISDDFFDTVFGDIVDAKSTQEAEADVGLMEAPVEDLVTEATDAPQTSVSTAATLPQSTIVATDLCAVSGHEDEKDISEQHNVGVATMSVRTHIPDLSLPRKPEFPQGFMKDAGSAVFRTNLASKAIANDAKPADANSAEGTTLFASQEQHQGIFDRGTFSTPNSPAYWQYWQQQQQQQSYTQYFQHGQFPLSPSTPSTAGQANAYGQNSQLVYSAPPTPTRAAGQNRGRGRGRGGVSYGPFHG
ncbi:hypothetical protein S7711_01137 [Stachybotrys chartarum IBT 7711]|uniref:AB hydrolase-1 domain-containing protein n=1 Tax=Stachybotrys chartarum (strain CBS 109288 / IBT 7711) TaxID=1280523 RepID=A0A084AST0_STACB|nr:hypothetical protein S7711_01137 [Stachybotrys chartarum IBT 7711]